MQNKEFNPDSIFSSLTGIVDYSNNLDGNSLTGNGIKICLVGSGVPRHHAIKATDYVNVSGTSKADDVLGHSTVVSGIIAGYEKKQFIGIAKDVDLYFANAISNDGECLDSSIVSSLIWAIIKDVDLILIASNVNLSNSMFTDVINKCLSANIGIITSYKNVEEKNTAILTVGVKNHNNEIVATSNLADVNVIGTAICTTYINNTYCIANGPLMSLAFAGGVAALILDKEKKKIKPISLYSHIKEIYKDK